MRKKKLPQKQTPTVLQIRDLFQTPREAVLDIIPFIPTKKVWESAAGEGFIARVLVEHGFEVICSDIRLEEFNYFCEFLSDLPPAPVQDWIKKGEKFSIITNPPYSIKKKFTLKCIEYNVPFALILQADYSQFLIDCITKYQCKKIVPYKRYNFIVPYYVKESKAQFHSIWLTRFFNIDLKPYEEYFLEARASVNLR